MIDSVRLYAVFLAASDLYASISRAHELEEPNIPITPTEMPSR